MTTPAKNSFLWGRGEGASFLWQWMYPSALQIQCKQNIFVPVQFCSFPWWDGGWIFKRDDRPKGRKSIRVDSHYKPFKKWSNLEQTAFFFLSFLRNEVSNSNSQQEILATQRKTSDVFCDGAWRHTDSWTLLDLPNAECTGNTGRVNFLSPSLQQGILGLLW